MPQLPAIKFRQIDLSGFCWEIEQILSSTIRDCYPHEWIEDHITLTLLRNLRLHFSNVRILGFAHELEIRWEVFKYTGKEENTYGDIALLIRIRYRNGKELEGVGLVEAKKRSSHSIKFDAVKASQLRRIVRNAPRAMLALYDYDRITGFPANTDFYSRVEISWEDNHRLYERLPMNVPYTNCVVVPVNLALMTNSFDTSLYNSSIPFSHQLCNRFFLGFDLEHDPEVIRAAKGFPTKKQIPRYVMVISVGQGTNAPESRDIMNLNSFAQFFE